MRVLEHCNVSASSEMQMQINALREAFSQDTSKPFELKPTLGLRSPTLEHHPTPPELRHAPHSAPTQGLSSWSHLQDGSSSKTMSPASEYGPPFDPLTTTHSTPIQPTMAYQNNSYSSAPTSSYGMQNLQQVTSAPQTSGHGLERVSSNEQQVTPVWDPSGLFNQWNSAFGPPQQTSPPTQSADPRIQQAFSAAPVPLQQQSASNLQAMYAAPHQPSPVAPSPSVMVGPEVVPPMPTVTPVMWQNAFTTAYVSGHGNKRYRQEDLDTSAYDQYVKRRG